ncbi:unnamed protein product [Hermetia illucens]|uniref:Peptidase S1 domain-containing protein n=1 Tax=Hermetia illucens TaxID=343691 RepID=A0A7R8UKJ0_HERIL|nr:trypsin-like [Hermetia illucens]CAD7082541.1 unnamed protein product [Hermetia illucens]
MFRLTLLCALIASALCYPQERVVGGHDADQSEYPFIVSLRSATGSHSCGSSILSEYWILTAAHCVSSAKPSSISIQYGVTTIASKGPNVASVAEIIVHEGYNPSNSYINDIALVRLASPLPIGSEVNAVKLPPSYTEVSGRTFATLIGWGLDKTGGSIQTHLQQVDLVTFDNPECSSLHYNKIHASNICAGVPEGGKGQCSGDSGGPLLINGYQHGIVSWSVKPCTVAPYPGVYTKVSHYVDWLRTKTGLNL